MATQLKKSIISAFKMHGLTLRSEASSYLQDVLEPVDSSEREQWLDKIIDIVQKQSLSSAMVGKEVCEAAVQECNAEQENDKESIFSVIDAFSIPRFKYSKERKKFIPESTLLKTPKLHGEASDKGEMFRDRYTVLHQRTLRHSLFTPPSLGSGNTDSNKFQLKPVEYLVGSTTKVGNVIVLGMLVQLKEGKWFLEDPTGCVQLDLSNAEFQPGLFTENSFVLAEGHYEDGVFYVDAFGLPPPEKADTTRSYFGNINFFGGPSAIQVKSSNRLAQIESENTDAMFVLLSDVWLDNGRVMDKLNILFKGYSEFPPTAFIFCGNYLSSPKVLSQAKILTDCFRDLGNMLSQYQNIIDSSKLIFVPGPNDPGHSTILPRPTIPNSITEAFRKKVPSAIFSSNPCRIQYCTQEIIIFREDIVTKLCRNCVRFPKDGNIPMHFAKSIISQAHLCPLPLHVSPVYWAYDSSLRLYPLPDVIVTADKFDPFSTTAVATTVINPGSFLRTDFGFKVYYPASKQVQDSQVMDEIDRTLISSDTMNTTEIPFSQAVDSNISLSDSMEIQ
ncbi:DNA polymerase epsilon subunit 2-like isoform X1 [Biomphalaria pfeifferi]|uniref:DNA polymerase epsilon subunit n=1 Tax=Biomphalaria pfeifferi TaxID=112525 RepID=A0AAD8B3L2_BIOPF|nr:DNA polymerase epsilon subunit 2-like isoform X1 [Biomphalaria pfeifferi]